MNNIYGISRSNKCLISTVCKPWRDAVYTRFQIPSQYTIDFADKYKNKNGDNNEIVDYFFCLGISIHKYILYTCKWLCINLLSLCYQLFFF